MPGVGGKAGCVRERNRRDSRSESADDRARKPELAPFCLFQILRRLVDLCLGFVACPPGRPQRVLQFVSFPGALGGGAVLGEVVARCLVSAFAQLALGFAEVPFDRPLLS
jgi:hypothetical protein